jgi:hypothetical protein
VLAVLPVGVTFRGSRSRSIGTRSTTSTGNPRTFGCHRTTCHVETFSSTPKVWECITRLRARECDRVRSHRDRPPCPRGAHRSRPHREHGGPRAGSHSHGIWSVLAALESGRSSCAVRSERGAEPLRFRAPRSNVQLAFGEGRGAEGDSGAGRAFDAEHDPSVHASSAERAPRSDRFAQLWAAGGQCSERCGLK